MNKKFSLLMGMVLTTILALSIVPSAFAGTWLFYDDGSFEGTASSPIGGYRAVKFTPPCSGAYILTARYYIVSGPNIAFNLHVFDSDMSTQLFGPLAVTPTSTGWFDVDLSSYGIRPSGDFYIAIEYTTTGNPVIGIDLSAPDSRSYTGAVGTWVLQTSYDHMIRAEVDCPVGGVVYSPDKLGLLSPLLMVTGLIGAIVFASFTMKKRRT